MHSRTRQLTIFEREIDTSKGPFSTTIPLPFGSAPFSLSFSELPCRCAPTMVCIPIVASLELNWAGFVGKALEIRKGSLSFERNGGSKREKVSVGIKAGKFPDTQEGSIKANSFVTSGREKMVTIKLELEVEIEEETTALTRSLDLLEGRATMDVCLVFPQERNRRLFASSKVLSEMSPYWKAQLSTQGFNELLESLDLADDMLDNHEEDSDLENTSEEEEEITSTLPPIPGHVRTIPIYGTAYNTYRALFTYIYTSQISFAPLSSTFASESARRAASALSRAFNPSTPTPCSPRSLYILSHFLSIPKISDLALDAYISSLTVDNALSESLSSFAEIYEEVKKGIVTWILESGKGRWEIIRKSKGAREWKERVRKEGFTDGELELLFKLSGIE